MANIPDHNDPKIYESDIKVFKQKYWYVDDDAEVHVDNPFECRLEVVVDDDGVFIESKEGNAREALSIPTPELAQRVAHHILNTYKAEKDAFLSTPEEVEEAEGTIAQVKFLGPDVQKKVARLLKTILTCRTWHRCYEADVYSHVMELSQVLDIKPEPTL